VGVARPARRRAGGGADSGGAAGGAACGAAGVQDRVHQLPADPATDAGLRRRRVHVSEGGAGLPGRGAEAATAARLGRARVRPAVDRAVARGQAGQAAGPAAAAAALRAALERAADPRPTARDGAAAADPGRRECRDPGPPRRVVVRDPHVALLSVIPVLYPEPAWEPGVHPTAIVGRATTWREPVAIGPYAVVGRETRLGKNVRIGAGCVLGDGVEVGDDV